MSSSSSSSDSESERGESYSHKRCIPLSSYYFTQPLVYFSEVQRKARRRGSNQNPQRSRRAKSKTKKTCLRKAFEWYTKGRCQGSRKSESKKLTSKHGSCICYAEDFEKFSAWLDGKYEEYLQEQRCTKVVEGRQPRSCDACNGDRDRNVSYIMKPNPLVKTASDSCTRGKSSPSEITTDPSRRCCKSCSASSIAPRSQSYVAIDECGPKNCPYRQPSVFTPFRTEIETYRTEIKPKKSKIQSEQSEKVVDCKSIGINCCECELGTQGDHIGKRCVCPTCSDVDSCLVNNLGTLIRTEKPYTVFVNDRSQTSDHSIKLDKDATGCYPFYMRVVCPDKLEPPCVCDYCPQPD